jgi:MFS family permease
MFFLALILFTIGTIVAAVSTNFTLMLIGRSLQGSGGGGIIVISEILVTDLVPLRHRGKWFGFLSSMWAIGSVSGPMIGGAFAMNNNWRWIFWINLPFIAISAVLGFIFVVLQFPPGSFASKLRSFDWVGSFLFIASMTGVLIPLTWGGVSFPWDSWHTLVSLEFLPTAPSSS